MFNLSKNSLLGHCLIVLFLCAQLFSHAHANTYGDNTHEHDGKICVLSTLVANDEEHDDWALPPQEIYIVPPPLVRQIYNKIAHSYNQKTLLNTSARSPPAG